jgi:type I restriction enzyme R subunit
MQTTFTDELEFESALVELLVRDKGWRGLGGKDCVLRYKTEADLLDNWAGILFRNNNTRDRLNGVPLTEGEKGQLMELVKACHTPLEANQLINGGSIAIKRDAEDDPEHLGHEISLKIYDRLEIAGGKSVYQIAEQPVFKTRGTIPPDRRGDLMLLINGLPVIHIELKRSGVAVTQAVEQIKKYMHEGAFTGLFSLVQVFVVMTPEETRYFANPSPSTDFDEKYMFHWADLRNERMDRWDEVAEGLLSIPMAHQLVGFYTVADDSDGVLKVMRSYQYWAASKIRIMCNQIDWDHGRPLGGYVWHTTGSGKTLTSFKSAQLIASSKKADKVVFLVDRIELGTQSFDDYKGFADATETVNATESTDALRGLLLDGHEGSTLIVTSIQKMNVLCSDPKCAADVEKIAKKRLVIIVDECHRSVFGDMMSAIRQKLPHALLFGFTGTPIVEANAKRGEVTTADVFGPELCHYTVADGIRDGNVLGFDVTYSSVFDETELREQVALDKAKAASVPEAMGDPRKKKAYLRYMHDVPMVARYWDEQKGRFQTGIEGLVPKSQYESDDYRREVVGDIRKNWSRLSNDGQFHALFATSSISEAVEYYRVIKELMPDLAVTALFDQNIDNNEGNIFKEDGLIEILEDYNARFGKSYTLSTYSLSDPKKDCFKRDVAARLAHKRPYRSIEDHPEQRLDLLVVVDQMLTGFDSKWLNTLYIDKVLDYERVIQAFSRTNRIPESCVEDVDKPFGSIRCYRMPNTMKANVEAALELYSEGAADAMFVPKLKENLECMNQIYGEIVDIFEGEGITGFSSAPKTPAARGQFALLWRSLNDALCAAKVQGFRFDRLEYGFNTVEGEHVLVNANDMADEIVTVAFDESTYLTIAMRYQELFQGSEGAGSEEVPYDIDPRLMRIDTTRIDAAYLEEKFDLWLDVREDTKSAAAQAALDELHSQFAKLTAEDQGYAEQIILDIQSGDIQVDGSWDLRDYINHAKKTREDELVDKLVILTGVNETDLRQLISAHPTEATLDLHGRFDALTEGIDLVGTKTRLERMLGQHVRGKDVSRIVDGLLRRFIVNGPFDVEKGAAKLL